MMLKKNITYFGRGMSADLDTAKELIQAAAEQGLAEAAAFMPYFTKLNQTNIEGAAEAVSAAPSIFM